MTSVMQALFCFRYAILELVRNSLGGRDFLAQAISDVLLCHNHGRMPQLVPRERRSSAGWSPTRNTRWSPLAVTLVRRVPRVFWRCGRSPFSKEHSLMRKFCAKGFANATAPMSTSMDSTPAKRPRRMGIAWGRQFSRPARIWRWRSHP